MSTLRQFTPARVGLGCVGNSLPTAELLKLRLAHARARDAVDSPFSAATLALDLQGEGLRTIVVSSEARDRVEYLRRPDLGRRLGPEFVPLVSMTDASYDIAFVVADGLSPIAVTRHALPFLKLVVPTLTAEGWTIAPIVIAERARVALSDEIGHRIGARLVVVLIGERPGLSSPDSLGIYLTWDPKPGRSDADRNCISNVRPEGLSYEAAAFKLLFLAREARRKRLSGVSLKDDSSRLRGQLRADGRE